MNEDFLKEINILINKKRELTHFIEYVNNTNLETNLDRFNLEGLDSIRDNFKNDYLNILNKELVNLSQEIDKFKINKL